MSNPSEDDWKRMLKLVDTYFQKPEAEPFREPVPWKALGLTDYPAVIKHPMDLGTIKGKIEKKKYVTLYQVAEDVRLVWDNCKTYNQDGSDFYKLASNLQKKWEKDYMKLLSDMGTAAASAAANNAAAAMTSSGAAGAAPSATTGSSSSSAKVSLQDKRNMAKMLYSITKEELGKVLVDVEAKCPSAIKRNAAEDELELNIDLIDAACMQDVMTYLNSLKANSTKKKASASKAKKPKVDA